MSEVSRNRGTIGEMIVLSDYLREGYQLVKSNYHSRYGEIDLIVEGFGYLVFVEVKLRASSRYGTPAAQVTEKKKQRIRNTALCYLQVHPIELQPRFDVVEVIWAKNVDEVEINRIENAF